jgi:hypothetical protein
MSKISTNFRRQHRQHRPELGEKVAGEGGFMSVALENRLGVASMFSDGGRSREG